MLLWFTCTKYRRTFVSAGLFLFDSKCNQYATLWCLNSWAELAARTAGRVCTAVNNPNVFQGVTYALSFFSLSIPFITALNRNVAPVNKILALCIVKKQIYRSHWDRVFFLSKIGKASGLTLIYRYFHLFQSWRAKRGFKLRRRMYYVIRPQSFAYVNFDLTVRFLSDT